jgi:hypothetical protein
MTESDLKSRRGKSSKVKKQKSTLPRTIREAIRQGYRTNDEEMTFESRDTSKRRGVMNMCIWIEGDQMMWHKNQLRSIFIPFTATYKFGRPRLTGVNGRKGHLDPSQNPEFDYEFAAKCAAKKGVQENERKKPPQSFEEVVQMWEKTGFKVPKTFDEFLYSDDPWKEEGSDENISDDWKTSQGTMLFATEENGCEVYLELPFKTVRTYGQPLISQATFLDRDEHRIALLGFKDGKAIRAGTFDERGRLEEFQTIRRGSEEANEN